MDHLIDVIKRATNVIMHAVEDKYLQKVFLYFVKMKRYNR